MSLCIHSVNFAFIVHAVCCGVVCNALERTHYYFGTKNSYEISQKYHRDFSADVNVGMNSFLQDTEAKNCEAVQLNGLLRHGTRNPGRKDLGKFTEFLLRIAEYVKDNGRSKTRVAQILYDVLDSWFDNDPFPNVTSADKELVRTGYGEMFQLGEKFYRHFTHLLSEPRYLAFISSNTHRTLHSCKAFQGGLQLSEEDSSCTINNQLLRFYDYCVLYLQTMEGMDLSQQEPELFKVGPEVQRVVRKLQDSLAVHRSHRAKPIEIEYQDLKAMYTIAASELAIHNTSRLASVFDQEDLLVMEYAADMRSYWKRSYGHVINYSQACQLLADIYVSLMGGIHRRKRFHKAVWRFAHAETLLPVMSLLGLYKDETPLTAHTFNKQHTRLFKTGKIVAFSANLVFVLYRCGVSAAGSELNYENYKIGLLHNERPVYLPPCPKDYLCPFDKFQSYYSDLVHECDFKEICQIRDHDEL